MESFPNTRLRRLRTHQWIRDLTAETKLSPHDLVWPVFVMEGENETQDIEHLPSTQRYTIDRLIPEVKATAASGIPAIALFPVVGKDKKSPRGDEALNKGNLVCRALSEIKSAVPEIGLIADVALDPYTSHAHDGLMSDDGSILNDETIEILAQKSLLLAQSGADIVAPSDMMDGRIGIIRQMLEENGESETMILSYAAKYASAFYGPFRNALANDTMLAGDKKTYQMNFTDRKMALREAMMDMREGADMLMVKPGLPYLDIVRDITDACPLPVFAYHVSGEYAMLKAASQHKWLDYDSCLIETLSAFKRAGCTGIFTYGAREAADILSAG